MLRQACALWFLTLLYFGSTRLKIPWIIFFWNDLLTGRLHKKCIYWDETWNTIGWTLCHLTMYCCALMLNNKKKKQNNVVSCKKYYRTFSCRFLKWKNSLHEMWKPLRIFHFGCAGANLFSSGRPAGASPCSSALTSFALAPRAFPFVTAAVWFQNFAVRWKLARWTSEISQWKSERVQGQFFSPVVSEHGASVCIAQPQCNVQTRIWNLNIFPRRKKLKFLKCSFPPSPVEPLAGPEPEAGTRLPRLSRLVQRWWLKVARILFSFAQDDVAAA